MSFLIANTNTASKNNSDIKADDQSAAKEKSAFLRSQSNKDVRQKSSDILGVPARVKVDSKLNQMRIRVNNQGSLPKDLTKLFDPPSDNNFAEKEKKIESMRKRSMSFIDSNRQGGKKSVSIEKVSEQMHSSLRSEFRQGISSDSAKEMLAQLEAIIKILKEKNENPSKKVELNDSLQGLINIAKHFLKANGEDSDSMPAQRRPGSIGLNLTDIKDLLFDEKVKPSQGHKKITDHIKKCLLTLNEDIPALSKGNLPRSTNAKNLLKWIEINEISSSPF